MELPTCRTCPYWDITQGGTEARPPEESIDQDTFKAECRRRSPVASFHERHGGPLFVEADDHSLVWPTTTDFDWCGEHPDFPAYLAMRRKTSPAVDLDHLKGLVDALPIRDRRIIGLRFGIGSEAYGRAEVARIVRLSVERVRQIERKATEKLVMCAAHDLVTEETIGPYLESVGVKMRAGAATVVTDGQAVQA